MIETKFVFTEKKKKKKIETKFVVSGEFKRNPFSFEPSSYIPLIELSEKSIISFSMFQILF